MRGTHLHRAARRGDNALSPTHELQRALAPGFANHSKETAMTASSTLTNPSATVSNMTERAHQTVDRVADKVVDKAAPALERARAGAHTTIDKVADGAACGAEWATKNGKALAERSHQATDMCAEYVRARPLVAVAGAVALGYLIGRLAR